MDNKQKAEKTYILLQQRRRDRERQKKDDYIMHTIYNMDRVMKKNYGRKVKQI
ncbi:hypothetical protein [Clostridium sporogenes]|uniref:hypothetical protein n=1 Tax=Clostridium sporogenes TaxID=1509 RepID=UPI00072914A7|nr:hypothetical protein [Clostridium sporogenes]KRU46319.1 hypothetical protein VT94_04930 [Clostridium sporogenes]MBY7064394.1 hypothetical protein [Clostridium sporogenes]MBY7071348.1 hypothetical protein [Clostridium sporogenes]MCW6064825.1 hypothetical protein [Clostridium sporogenes]OQP89721.1 hypothetical protein VT93_0201280 [Clostridium sporogenes]